MALSAAAVLSAGSQLAYEDPAVVDTWIDLVNCLQFGEVGGTSAFMQTTPISKTEHEYAADVSDSPDVEMVFNDIADTVYNTLLTSFVDNKTAIRFRVTYSNGRTAIRTVALGSRKVAEAQFGSQVKMIVAGKQSGDVTWGITA